MLTRDRRRSAFTLIELLVVVSIIAILVALTATAAFGVRRNMQKQNAEATLEKLDQKVVNKVKAINDQIHEDARNKTPEYNSALALAGSPEGAKAVMKYARMKREFPVSFGEARNNFTVGGHTYPASPAFNGLPMAAANSPTTWDQSAACLYAAIAPMGLDGLENQVGTNAAGQKVFTDGFGTPIAFVRLAYDGNANELNVRPQAINPAVDPFDPDNKAVGVLPGLWATLNNPAMSDGGSYPQGNPYRSAGNNRNHTIVLISAGINRQWNDGPQGIYDGDNLLSYRLRREGKHGD